jgi:HD-GYP domain-containing protein (c-di-GMP phosphodiesterase class II)
MSSADNSRQPDSHRALPVIVYFEEDDFARAALSGSRKLNRISWHADAVAPTDFLVLITTSEQLLTKYRQELPSDGLRVIALSDNRFSDPELDAAVFGYLPADTPGPLIDRFVENALNDIRAEMLHRELLERVKASADEIDELNRIGIALSAEHEIRQLFEMILTKARQITSADAGSIYLVEGGAVDSTPVLASPSGAAPRATHPGPELVPRDSSVPSQPLRLRFAWMQNETISLRVQEMAMEANHASIAGHVALTGDCVQLDDAYMIPPELPFTIDRSFDAKLGYHTKSILAVPMRNEKDEVVGVLQLMNCKRDFAAKLTSRSAVTAQVLPFTAHHRELILSLASQAGVALQNSRLLTSIEDLFEGFVRASVIAIEERDPTTFGHSFRVAQMVLALATEVNRITTGPLAEVQFTPHQMKELRYAALLHDFGKVGVRENVLLKATKLYPEQLELLRQRLLLAKRTAEAESLREQLDFLLDHGELAYRTYREAEAKARLGEYWAKLDALWNSVQRSNLPTITPQLVCAQLAEAAGLKYEGLDGISRPLLTEEEARLLSIPKGSLDPEERAQMEAHVIYTVRFLSQIPWTTELRGVTAIAAGHHEKLNGSGYPYQLSSSNIPVQTRMITIVDIFDGLTASDRPYKRAVTPEEALEILRSEVDSGAIDPDLFGVFVELVRQRVHKGEGHEQSSVLADHSALA